MALVVAADTVTDRTEEPVSRAEDGDPAVRLQAEDAEDRLETLSEKITMCNRVLSDLKDLSEVLVRKCLQDVSLPSQK